MWSFYGFNDPFKMGRGWSLDDVNFVAVGEAFGARVLRKWRQPGPLKRI